jgi:transposase-like protein
MSRSTISTFQLFEMFPDQETARVYLESRLWPTGPRCPVCGSGERITVRKRGFYRCNACREDFTVRTGTIFERSHVPLHKWLYAMYLVVTARKGISSMQLAKEIGVTQKTAWFVLGRLREACKGNLTKLRGIIEIDETFVGGLEANKHEPKRRRQGRGPVGKQAVLGMRERGGRTIGVLIGNTDANTIHPEIHRHVEIGSTLHTDEAGAYRNLGELFFGHAAVNHGIGEFARYPGKDEPPITVNGIESVFAVLKRGINGVFHHVTPKHLGRYVDEFSFRLNEGNVKHHTLTRLDSFIVNTAGRRLTYKALIA